MRITSEPTIRTAAQIHLICSSEFNSRAKICPNHWTITQSKKKFLDTTEPGGADSELLQANPELRQCFLIRKSFQKDRSLALALSRSSWRRETTLCRSSHTLGRKRRQYCYEASHLAEVVAGSAIQTEPRKFNICDGSQSDRQRDVLLGSSEWGFGGFTIFAVVVFCLPRATSVGKYFRDGNGRVRQRHPRSFANAHEYGYPCL